MQVSSGNVSSSLVQNLLSKCMRSLCPCCCKSQLGRAQLPFKVGIHGMRSLPSGLRQGCAPCLGFLNLDNVHRHWQLQYPSVCLQLIVGSHVHGFGNARLFLLAAATLKGVQWLLDVLHSAHRLSWCHVMISARRH